MSSIRGTVSPGPLHLVSDQSRENSIIHASSSRLSGSRLCGMHFVLQQQLNLHLSFDTFAA